MPPTLKLLLTSFDYRPRLGGVATCSYETAKALSRFSDVQIRFMSPRGTSRDADEGFDSHHLFETKRVLLPSTAAAAIVPWAARIATETLLWQPDAILNFLWMPCGVASLLATPGRAIHQTPYFVVTHGVEVLESNRTFKKRLRAQLAPAKNGVLKNAAGVFAVSNFTADLVATNCGVAREKITVIYNGVDSGIFHPTAKPADLMQKYNLEGKHVFLTVTRFESYKGVDHAIGAMKQVVQRIPNAVYLVCGDGSDRARLTALVKKHGLENYVIFSGPVAGVRLKDYYNLCDTFVLLTRDDRKAPNVEGFGIVFLEAAACAKPAIAGKSGGIPDAVADGETGWLVPPEDENLIAAAFIEAVENPDKTRRLGLNALRRAREKFGWDQVALKILNQIRQRTSS